jgi:Glycosyl hydrolase family 99
MPLLDAIIKICAYGGGAVQDKNSTQVWKARHDYCKGAEVPYLCLVLLELPKDWIMPWKAKTFLRNSFCAREGKLVAGFNRVRRMDSSIPAKLPMEPETSIGQLWEIPPCTSWAHVVSSAPTMPAMTSKLITNPPPPIRVSQNWHAVENRKTAAQPPSVSRMEFCPGITSFNEWHEGTQIETAVPKQIPGFSYLNYQRLTSDYYLDRTAQWIRRMNSK